MVITGAFILITGMFLYGSFGNEPPVNSTELIFDGEYFYFNCTDVDVNSVEFMLVTPDYNMIPLLVYSVNYTTPVYARVPFTDTRHINLIVSVIEHKTNETVANNWLVSKTSVGIYTMREL